MTRRFARVWLGSVALALGVASGGCAATPEEPTVDTAAEQNLDSTPATRDDALKVYASNVRAHSFLNRLLEGWQPSEVLALVNDEIKFVDGSIATLVRTHYERSPDRVRYMATLEDTRAKLVETKTLVTKLARTPGWEAWFPAEGVCGNVETIDVRVVETIRGIIRARVGDGWAALAASERRTLVASVISDAGRSFPERATVLAAAAESEAILAKLVTAPDAAHLEARLSWTLQLIVAGTIKRITCPGDGRINETSFAYDWKTQYNYANIPAKDIFVMRAVTTPAERDTKRFTRSDYALSVQGIDANGLLAAGPLNVRVPIVGIAADGSITKGEGYARYFSRFGTELPDRVPAAQVESLVHAVDGYLAGHLEHEQIDLTVTVLLTLAASVTTR
jgi:hypothetical protein